MLKPTLVSLIRDSPNQLDGAYTIFLKFWVVYLQFQ